MAPPGVREFAGGGQVAGVVIAGARHASFTGRIDPSLQPTRVINDPMLGDPTTTRNPMTPTGDPRRPGREGSEGLRIRNVFANVKAISLAFWDTYLKSEAEGRTTLEGAGGRGGIELVKK